MSIANDNFRKVLDQLGADIEKLGFTPWKNEEGKVLYEKEGDLWAKYTGEKGVIAFTLSDGKLVLFSGEDAETPETADKKLSACLFDDRADDRDIKYAVSDLRDTLNDKFGEKAPVKAKKASNKTATVSKAAVKAGSFYDENTLASRLCHVYPQLRPLHKANIDKYGEFFAEEFFADHATALIIGTIKQNDPATMKKLFQVLNEIYEDGTNDTQSLIAVSILGELGNDQILLARCVDYMSETMAPPVIEVNKYLASAAGKKAKKLLANPPAYKPKKQKKQSAFMKAMMEGGGMPNPPAM